MNENFVEYSREVLIFQDLDFLTYLKFQTVYHIRSFRH